MVDVFGHWSLSHGMQSMWPHVVREEFRLFPRREVAALVQFVGSR
jgi:hypothetical protein